MSTEDKQVYLDHMANTPPDSRVLEAMAAHLKTVYGNPLNLHDFGGKTSEAIESARQNTAALIGAEASEIIFTSCGSESNNFAVKGIAKALRRRGSHLITSEIEHFSVLYSFKELEKEGFRVTYLPVDRHGIVDADKVARALTSETTLVSLTHASNEIGTIEPVSEIGALLRTKDIAFHVDAIQTVGTIPVDVNELNADALSLAANMFYGPTGVAALYLRKKTRILPYIIGGTQEEGKRAGTHNIGGIVAMGVAAELSKKEMVERNEKLISLRNRLMAGLMEKIDEFYVTGHPENRLPGHVSGIVKYIEGESMSMLLNMQGIAVSTGSACVSKALKASHVLMACGVFPEDAHGSLVLSMGKDNTMEDVEYVLEKLPPIVSRLREMSPLYSKK